MGTIDDRDDTCELCMYVTERLGESIAGLPVSVTWYCALYGKDLKPKTPVCEMYRWGARKYAQEVRRRDD